MTLSYSQKSATEIIELTKEVVVISHKYLRHTEGKTDATKTLQCINSYSMKNETKATIFVLVEQASATNVMKPCIQKSPRNMKC